jgi:amino acid adenylation domain-containing protein
MTIENLYDWFDRSARLHPAEVALEVGDRQLRYDQLAELVERLGIRLTAGGRPRRVGVLARRNVAAYVTFLATLRIGATVVPINPAFPLERNRMILAAVAVDLVVGDEASADQLDRLTRATAARGLMLETGSWEAELPAGEPATVASIDSDDLAYVLFTSGSTGTPKGVPITHANISSFLSHRHRHYDVGPGTRWSQTSDLGFDLSLLEMFVTWASGGTLVIPLADDLLSPVAFIQSRSITHWLSVPSVVAVARRLRTLTPNSMPGLRRSIFAGEQLTLAQADTWARAAPESLLENLYGPSELTVACTGYQLPRHRASWPSTSNGTVPIGRVFPHLDWRLAGGAGDPATVGELWVRGAQRFPGYLGGPAAAPDDWHRTGDRVQVGPDGFVHLDRLDRQLKISGHRVELGDVEHAVRRHPQVEDVVAVAIPDSPTTEIVVFYTGERVPADGLARIVAQRLPAALVPMRYTHLTSFPLNSNGKVDVRRLTASARRQ